MIDNKTGWTVLAALPLLALFTAPAAAIECDGRYQIVNGHPISTPYCEDNYLARLAGVDPRALRHNPLLKEQVCRAVGYDPRVNDICFGHLPDGEGNLR